MLSLRIVGATVRRRCDCQRKRRSWRTSATLSEEKPALGKFLLSASPIDRWVFLVWEGIEFELLRSSKITFATRPGIWPPPFSLFLFLDDWPNRIRSQQELHTQGHQTRQLSHGHRTTLQQGESFIFFPAVLRPARQRADCKASRFSWELPFWMIGRNVRTWSVDRRPLGWWSIWLPVTAFFLPAGILDRLRTGQKVQGQPHQATHSLSWG